MRYSFLLKNLINAAVAITADFILIIIINRVRGLYNLINKRILNINRNKYRRRVLKNLKAAVKKRIKQLKSQLKNNYAE